MNKTICFDMDGTFVNLYGVENWLGYLLEKNPYPYMVAEPLVNLSWFARTIHDLQKIGYEIGVISWLAKDSTKEYDELVADAKMDWLAKHLPSVQFDFINIVEYGTPKSTCGCGYLFDDEERNRIEWEHTNEQAFDVENLIKTLRIILKEEKEIEMENLIKSWG